MRALAFFILLLNLASTIAHANPAVPNGVIEGWAAIFDGRAIARQQNRRDCWAHGAEVSAKLASMTRPVIEEEPVVYADDEEEGTKPLDSFPRGGSSRGAGERSFQDTLNLNPQNYAAEHLWNAVGLMGTDGPHATGFATDRVGWTRDLDIRPTPDQGESRQEIAENIAAIVQAMKIGIRLEGFFNHRHAMAIVGADAAEGVLYLTDSERRGNIIKTSLTDGLHLDSMLSFVRKDNQTAIDWLNQWNAVQ